MVKRKKKMFFNKEKSESMNLVESFRTVYCLTLVNSFECFNNLTVFNVFPAAIPHLNPSNPNTVKFRIFLIS